MDQKGQRRLGISILIGIALITVFVLYAFPPVSDTRCLNPHSPACLEYQAQVIRQWVPWIEQAWHELVR
jgi:hypothetical protein